MSHLRLSIISFVIFLFAIECYSLNPSRIQNLRPSKIQSLLQLESGCKDNCSTITQTSTQTTTTPSTTTTSSTSATTPSTSTTTQTTSTTGRLQKVGVYYGNWDGYGRNFQICNVPGDKLDYLFYSFLDPSTGTCQFSDAFLDLQKAGPINGVCGGTVQPSSDPLLGNMYQLKMLKQRFPNLKVIAAIGGYTFSKAFHNYIGTATARTNLVSSCVKLLTTYASSLDGFDIDLEYPCISSDVPCGDNITPTSDDKGNFAALIQEFRRQMGPTPYLSVATSADQTKIKALDFTLLDPALTAYHIMSYDFTGGEYGVPYTGHHTQLKANPNDPDSYRKTLSAEIAASTFVKNGASPSKINIGCAFYGKSFTIAKTSSTASPFVKDTGAPTFGTWDPAIFDYSDIKLNYQTSTNRFFDSASQATYILDTNKGLYITYDDPQSIQAKTAFVRSNGYMGVFAWELAGDTNDFQLVQAMGN